MIKLIERMKTLHTVTEEWAAEEEGRCCSVCVLCMWYKSNQRELDSTNAKSAHYSCVWWCKLVDWCSPCLCCSSHSHSFQANRCDGSLDFDSQLFFPFCDVHFYIVSICDVYLSISKMRNALTNENGSNAVHSLPLYLSHADNWSVYRMRWESEKKCKKKLWKCIRTTIFCINVRAHSRPYIYFDSMQFIVFGFLDKMKRINLNLCKM